MTRRETRRICRNVCWQYLTCPFAVPQADGSRLPLCETELYPHGKASEATMRRAASTRREAFARSVRALAHGVQHRVRLELVGYGYPSARTGVYRHDMPERWREESAEWQARFGDRYGLNEPYSSLGDHRLYDLARKVCAAENVGRSARVRNAIRKPRLPR